VDQHLVDEPKRGSYRLHDLLHTYARHLAHDADAESEAVTRLFAYQRHGADRAGKIIFPNHPRLPHPFDHQPFDAPPPAAVPAFPPPEAADQWLRAEPPGLLAAIPYARDHRRHHHAAWLGHLLGPFLESRGHWEEGIDALRVCVVAWREIGRP